MDSADSLYRRYDSCQLCPHACAVNRNNDGRGVCGEGAELRLSVAGLHFGEEPPLTGEGGSGTIFITGCAMQCPFCQNYQISRSRIGRAVEKGLFLDILGKLVEAGAENFNLVTPSHMVPTLKDFFDSARDAGLDLPVAWNSSGYESLESVSLASKFVDIWLPDLKSLDAEVSRRRYGLGGYPEAAGAAITAMADCGPPVLDTNGRLLSGLMVRHLVLPGEMESTRGVLRWFAENLSGRAWLSLMTQYTPVRIPGEKRPIPERQLKAEEYDRLIAWLEEFGIDDGFLQDLVPGSDWLPDFRRRNPFSSELSRIIWHWEDGFL